MKVPAPGILQSRSALLRRTRDFFYQRDFLEVDTPHLDDFAGLEPHLDPYEVRLEGGRTGHLITSPERALKKILGSGVERIFEIAHSYRAGERGPWHSREFLMLEWYVLDCTLEQLMTQAEEFVQTMVGRPLECCRVSVYAWMKKHLGHGFARADMERTLAGRTDQDVRTMSYDEIFFRLFLPTESQLQKEELVLLYDYPAELSAYAQVCAGVGRRFEMYYKGVELANAFLEITDPEVLEKKLRQEQDERRRLGRTVYAIDREFVEALADIRAPVCGIALGWDRLFGAHLGLEGLAGTSTYAITD